MEPESEIPSPPEPTDEMVCNLTDDEKLCWWHYVYGNFYAPIDDDSELPF